MHLAYRLAVIQWWAALAWGLWLLAQPMSNGFDNVAASVVWCGASVLVIVLKGREFHAGER